jgi:NADH dehydrogenase FAD-containing subunit
MVTDIADHFGRGAKDVTLIHSRPHLMNRFDSHLHDIVMRRMEELGVNVILSNRVKSWGDNELILQDGRRLQADLIVRRFLNATVNRTIARLTLRPV